jgi:hypothetical protein
VLPFSKTASADLGLLQDKFDTVVSCKNPIICPFFMFCFSVVPAILHRDSVSNFDDFL